jgi:hypothetical protein
MLSSSGDSSMLMMSGYGSDTLGGFGGNASEMVGSGGSSAGVVSSSGSAAGAGALGQKGDFDRRKKRK